MIGYIPLKDRKYTNLVRDIPPSELKTLIREIESAIQDEADADWIYVESNSLKAIKYNRPSKELLIKFQSGETYRYNRIEPDVWSAFLSDRSKGRFFIRNIKDKRYGTKVHGY